MSEVCELCQIKPYVLRFWDTEFEQIQSVINSSGKKLYQKKDIIVISVLKELLFDRKLTIEKARHELNQVDFNQIIKSQSQQSIKNKSLSAEKKQSQTNEVTTGSLYQNVSSFAGEQFKKIDYSKSVLGSVLTRISGIKQRYNWC